MGFVLDKNTGTFVEETPQEVQVREKEAAIEETASNVDVVSQGQVKVVTGRGFVDLPLYNLVDKATGEPVGIIGDNGMMPELSETLHEKYSLVAVEEPMEVFKRLTDLSVFQIIDKPTGKITGIISGYALQIKFNREAITSTADVEQCAEGIKKLFYGIIMDELLGNN